MQFLNFNILLCKPTANRGISCGNSVSRFPFLCAHITAAYLHWANPCRAHTFGFLQHWIKPRHRHHHLHAWHTIFIARPVSICSCWSVEMHITQFSVDLQLQHEPSSHGASSRTHILDHNMSGQWCWSLRRMYNWEISRAPLWLLKIICVHSVFPHQSSA